VHATREERVWTAGLFGAEGCGSGGVRSGGGSGGANATAASKFCFATATVPRPIHTLPIECWPRSGDWSDEEGSEVRMHG